MRYCIAAALVTIIFAADQGTKLLIEAALSDPPHVIPVTSFFNLALGYNRGISFGLFASNHIYAPYVLAIVALAVVAGLTAWLLRSNNTFEKLGLVAIIGGAVGNIIDRLEDGAVTDFLDFYVGTYHWPAFNVADVAITCGVVILLFESLRPQRRISCRRERISGGARDNTRTPDGE